MSSEIEWLDFISFFLDIIDALSKEPDRQISAREFPSEFQLKKTQTRPKSCPNEPSGPVTT